MKFSKIHLFFLCVIIMIGSTSCANVKDSMGGARVTPEMLESVSRSLAETTVTVADSISEEAETIQTTTTMKNADNEKTSVTKMNQTEITTPQTTIATSTIADETISTSISVITTEISTQASGHEDSISTTTLVNNPIPEIVYWTESGEVYHVTDQCSALRRSKKILQGSVEEALAAKKERPCKTCS